jgi:flagellar protein FlbT
MALNIDLKPNERIIIANVSVRNGDRRTRLIFETEAKFLREKDMLPASEAKTACEHLYVLLQVIYFLGNSSDLENRFVASSNEIMSASPSTAAYIADIYDKFTAGEYYPSLKSGQKLMQYEKELLGRLEVAPPK